MIRVTFKRSKRGRSVSYTIIIDGKAIKTPQPILGLRAAIDMALFIIEILRAADIETNPLGEIIEAAQNGTLDHPRTID